MLKSKIVRNAVLAAAGLLAAWLVFAGPAESAATPVQVSPLPTPKQEPGKPVTLGVKVVDTTIGRAVSGVDVTFMIETDVFGPRLMTIGKAATDATGSAYVQYKPTWVGDTNVVARFAGNGQYAAADGKFSFAAVGPAHVHENAKFGLEPVRGVAPFIVLALVVAVWGALIYTLFHAVSGIGMQLPVRVPLATTVRRHREEPAEVLGEASEGS